MTQCVNYGENRSVGMKTIAACAAPEPYLPSKSPVLVVCTPQHHTNAVPP